MCTTISHYFSPASEGSSYPSDAEPHSCNAGFPEEEFLHLAAAAEASSEHPLGKAVTAHARLQLRPAQGRASERPFTTRQVQACACLTCVPTRAWL